MAKKMMMVVFMAVMAFGLWVTPLRAIQIDDITCTEALPLLLPCQPFLVGEPSPSSACCQGAQTVFQRANTTQNRRDLCKCFKNAATQIGLDPAKAKQLPQLCGISLSFPIDPNIDCSTIPFPRGF